MNNIITRSPLPKTQKAYTQSATGFPLTLTYNALVPTVKPGQVLIRVHVTALNPTDHKMPTSFPSPGAVAGCDFAGTVIQTASQSQADSALISARLQVGDGVFGAVHGSNPIDHCSGALAEYIAADADLLIKIPKGRQTLERMSWTQAAAWGGIGWGTLGIALWDEERGLGLQWPWGQYKANGVGREGDANGASKGDGAYVLVNGGATATGTLAVQLLRLAGYRPIATCSPKHDALLRSFGAVSTFDYNVDSCATSIRTQTSNGIRHVLDCIADAASVSLCYAAMSRAGGRYACLELPSAAALEARKAVSWRFVMGYEVYGRKIALGKGYNREGKEEYRSKAARWAEEVQKLMDAGLLMGHPVEVLDGRWEESVPKGLERLRSGEVRGVKLVAKIQEQERIK